MIGRAAAMVLAAFAVGASSPVALVAQSAQPWSVQPSFLAASQDINETLVSGVGFEGQVRYTPASLWSGGLGVRYSTHSSGDESIDITGLFFEPRYTLDIGSDRAVPYLAGRVSALRQSADLNTSGGLVSVTSNGFGIGAGAGILVRLTDRVNADGGAALVNQGFGDAREGGVTVSFDRFFGYVAKVGVSIGFGTR